MKKAVSIILCLVALLSVLCGPVSTAHAATVKAPLTKEQQLINSTRKSYTRSQATAGRSSFHGYCGLMTSHQLRNLGINTWRVTNDGNNQYDYYAKLEVTTGGYYINAYPVSEYSLEEALNHVSRYGTRDVYNILVGFQRTNTQAGKRYGHAMLINGIIDGNVYFVESFSARLNNKYYPEGNVIVCTIAQFAEYYGKWTTYEGIIYFGTGDYSQQCHEIGTNVMVQSRFATALRSQPCVLGQNGSQSLRMISAGERLRATAIVEDTHGDLYYRIEEGDTVGYVAASAVYTQRINPEDLDLRGGKFPTVILDAKDAGLSGTVIARRGSICVVEAVVTDNMGNKIKTVRREVQDYRWDIANLNAELALETLDPDVYLVEIYAECNIPVVQQGQIETVPGRVRLGGQAVQVGQDWLGEKPVPVLDKIVEQVYEGWVFENNGWYFYQDGQPVTGWLTECGVRYYLGQDGKAVTGAAEVDGKQVCFSESGALITGWHIQAGTQYYRLEDGTIATGWQELETGLYYLDKNGQLVTKKTVKKDGVKYVLAADGKATKK